MRVLTAPGYRHGEAKANDGDRLYHAFRLMLSRPPSAYEHERLMRLLAEQRAGFEAAPQDAKQIAPPQLPKEIDLKHAAAWTMTARVMMNLDEFITRE